MSLKKRKKKKKKPHSQYSYQHPRTYDYKVNGVPGQGYNFWIWGRIWVKGWSTKFKLSSRPHVGRESAGF